MKQSWVEYEEMNDEEFISYVKELGRHMWRMGRMHGLTEYVEPPEANEDMARRFSQYFEEIVNDLGHGLGNRASLGEYLKCQVCYFYVEDGLGFYGRGVEMGDWTSPWGRQTEPDWVMFDILVDMFINDETL